MNHHTICASMFVTAMLAASAVFAAGSDIVKCVDQEGHVTLTDAQCGGGAGKVVVNGPVEAPAEAVAVTVAADEEAAAVPAAPAAAPALRRVTVERYVLPPAPQRLTGWAAPRQASRPLARDVETLKAARLSMQVLDQTSATMRHQRLAGLN